jgi:hypothetical protein
LGVALDAGRKRVPRPAAGMTALETWAFSADLDGVCMVDGRR